MTGWTPALRIARREMLRAKGRSLLALLMVLLPVVAVTTGSTLLRTSEISAVEGLPLQLGSATAQLDVGQARVEQDPRARSIVQYDPVPPATVADLREALPEGARLLPAVLPYTSVRLQVDGSTRRVGAVGVDLSDPDLREPFRVLEGAPAAAAGEVAVSRDLADRGVGIGDSVLVAGEQRQVTGVVAGPRDLAYGETLFGPAEALGLEQEPTRYWVSGPEVAWQDVQELNALGVLVLSRSVVLDPPPASEYTTDPFVDDQRAVAVTIGALVVAMAVLLVVLLAGPAFAVSARRQRRSLALLAAGGAAPPQVRRVVLAQGVLVGLVSVAVGLPLGVAVAAAGRGPLTRFVNAEFGPFEVGALDLLLIAVLAFVTALLAALLPAFVLARQPLVAALHGRRLTASGARRPALAGLVLVAVGVTVIVTSLQGSSPYGYAEVGVALGALPTVLGAVLLAPAALALVGRLAGRLPLPLRFAARDADRQRGRTAPAVAAITAVVAAVVALGTGASSDAEQNRRSYVASGPPGTAVVTAYEPDVDLTVLERIARDELPEEQVQVVRGVPVTFAGQDGYTSVETCAPGEAAADGRCASFLTSYSSGLGSDVLVGEEGLSALGGLVPAAELAALRTALARGEVLVAVTSDAVPREPSDQVELRQTRFALQPDGTERVEVLRTAEAPLRLVLLDSEIAPFKAVVPDAVGDALGAAPVGLLVGDDVGRADESALRTALESYDSAVGVRVERGYEDSGDRTVLLVLSLVVGVLVLGGTLAATALALSEARPDLATLGQVGARPRTRRLVAGSYALVLGLVGAVLGTAAGLVPGIAVAVPLTRSFGGPGQDGTVVQLPWTVLALVLVALPLLSAAVAALAARGGSDGPRRVVA